MEREVVSREFEAAQRHFGVDKRKDLLALRRKRERRQRRGSSGELPSGSVDAVASELAAHSDDFEIVELRSVEEIASILAGLSRRAWEERISVEECEEWIGKP